MSALPGANIFKAFSNDAPPIASRPDHPVPKTWIRTRSQPVSNTQLIPLSPADSTPLETNKFYSNLFLGSQSCSAWTQPYSIWWSKGRGNVKSWGLSVTHIERSGLAYGPLNAQKACNFFFGPIGTFSLPSDPKRVPDYQRHSTNVSISKRTRSFHSVIR